MAFAEEIEKEASRAKKFHPRKPSTIDRVKQTFIERHEADGFAGLTWDEVSEQFHNAVTGACQKRKPHGGGKDGPKRGR
jgi:hypothetical protein